VESQHLREQTRGVGQGGIERRRVQRREGAVRRGEDGDGVGRVERVDKVGLGHGGHQRGEDGVAGCRGGDRIVGHAGERALVGTALHRLDQAAAIADRGRVGGAGHVAGGVGRGRLGRSRLVRSGAAVTAVGAGRRCERQADGERNGTS
jgi:hypothetical protein